MAEWVFWGAVLLLLHTYFFYPSILVALNRQKKREARARVEQRTGAPALPSVSIVVAAYNEEGCIQQKLENSLALDYPKELLEILVGSDGSTDRTEALVRSCRDRRVRLSTAPRAGKTSVLNRCIPQASGDIIVLTDANTMIQPDAIRKLVAHFEDPEVGVVCGSLRLYNPTSESYEESAYWRYESFIKEQEGARGTVLGANGGLYAIRRSLFTALPPSTIVDDFVIPMRIIERGFRGAYEKNAVAHEETTEDYDREFGRRARIAAGNFQSLAMVPRLLLPSAGFTAFAFWSHKVLRWSAPALMVLAFLANLLMIGSGLYRLMLFAQFLFYALAWAGSTGALPGALRRVGSIAYYFVSMNVAMTVGFWRFLRNSQGAAWDRTARA